jgi:hypothetical protein
LGCGLIASAPAWCDDWEYSALLPKTETVQGFLELLEHPDAEEELFTRPELLRKICHAFMVADHSPLENPSSEEISRAIRSAERLLSTDSPSERWVAGSHLLFLYGKQPNLDLLEAVLANFGKLSKVVAKPARRRRRTGAFLPKPLTDTQLCSFKEVLSTNHSQEMQSRVRELLRRFSDLHISTLTMRATPESYLKLIGILIWDAGRTGDTRLEFISDADIGRVRQKERLLLEALLNLAPESPPVSERLVHFAAACTPLFWQTLRKESPSMFEKLRGIAHVPVPSERRVKVGRQQVPQATSQTGKKTELVGILAPLARNASALGEFQGNTTREWQAEIARWKRSSKGNTTTLSKLMLLLLDPPSLATAKVAAETLGTYFIRPALAKEIRFAEFLDVWFEDNPNPPMCLRASMLRTVSNVYGESWVGILLQLKSLKSQGVHRPTLRNLRGLDLSEVSAEEARLLSDSVERILSGRPMRGEAKNALEELNGKLVRKIKCPSLLADPPTSTLDMNLNGSV